LIADEKVIGAISLYSSELTHYQDEHLRLLETVSLIAADAISNSLQHTEAEISALTDPMTGLPNARSLQIEFEKELGRSTRNGNNFQVLVLDLDGFKAVNDTFGHKAGDAMLKELGNVIRHQLRDYDFLARYGGDEFVAIVPDTESADVLELCRRIENAVGNFVLPIGDDIFAKVGISIGSASYPNHGSTFDQIINAADKAMYRTKAFHKQRKSRLDAKLYMTLLPVAGPETEQIQRPAGELPEPQHRYESDDVVQPIPRPSNPPLEYDEEDALILELDESHLMASSAVN
jgi:diguanylate cyclase (GGDEF)-like protein